MVRYRLRLHAPISVRTFISEANCTHTRASKPLYVRQALSDAEVQRYNVRLLDTPFCSGTRASVRCTTRSCAYRLEQEQRLVLNRAIEEELEVLAAQFPRLQIHVSDVDEVLDASNLAVHLKAQDSNSKHSQGVASLPLPPPRLEGCYRSRLRTRRRNVSPDDVNCSICTYCPLTPAALLCCVTADVRV